ncbi:unnamed protein product, partial [Amoebophrya sp. A25]
PRFTLLTIASSGGNPEILKYLIEHCDASVNNAVVGPGGFLRCNGQVVVHYDKDVEN